jgi:hypothetical protein
MSTTAITNPAIYTPATTPVTQTNGNSARSEIMQLGQDLQAGNLSAAQQDYVTLSQGPLANQQNSTNPLVQDLQAVGTALQAGNLNGAQQAFSTFQQTAAQNASARQAAHGGHHHHGGGNGQENNALAQAFNSLEQALQSGNLTTAQSAFTTLQSDLQQAGFGFAANPTSSAGGTSTTTNATAAVTGLNVTA